MRFGAVVTVFLSLGAASFGARAASTDFLPTPGLRPATLLALMHEQSTRGPMARLEIESAKAGRIASRMFANPIVDFSWNTVPIGPTNPRGLASPINNVPNYSLGVSYTFDWLKRGARARWADAEVAAAQATSSTMYAEDTWALARVLGRIAVAQLRQEAAAEMRRDAGNAIDVARARAHAGASSLLDLDRMENEQLRAELEVIGARAEMSAASADCATLIGRACAPFGSHDDANAFLQSWIALARATAVDAPPPPVLRALDAKQRAASAEGQMVQNTPIPDVTLRFGYVHDRFLESGAQQNSLNVSVAVPLALANRAQAERAAATARNSAYAAARDRLLGSLARRQAPLRATLDDAALRVERLDREMLPRARAVLAALSRASDSRLLPLTDTLQARRSLNELLRDRADSAGAAFEAAVAVLSLSDLEVLP